MRNEELKACSAEKKHDCLMELARLMVEHRNEFIECITKEAGKAVQLAEVEVDRALFTIKAAARECYAFTGETVPMDYGAGVGKSAFTKRFPIGPVFGVVPFNFPLNLGVHKLAPALAMGCPIVLKPSPMAPGACILLGTLIEKAGFPPGSVSVLLASPTELAPILKDRRMKMLSFTGSAEIGWTLKGQAQHMKVVLELGGNGAVLVDRGADCEKWGKDLATAAFLYSGQICISTQRVYCVGETYDGIITSLAAAARDSAQIVSGSPMERGTINGPVISRDHLNRIHRNVEEAVSAGAKLVCGGKILDEAHNIYAPTVLTNTTPEMAVVREEIFGPVVVVEPVSDFSVGITAINDSAYGLQAGVITDSVGHMKEAHEKIEVGGIIINHPPGFRMDTMPYGGVKDSGLGREGIRYAMEDMSEPRILVF